MSVPSYPFHSLPLRPYLGGENGIEWKEMKRIFLEYSSLPLFGSFNEGNESLRGREWNG